MKLQISVDKYVDLKKTSGISYTLGIVEDSPFGNNYLAINVSKDKKLSDLLNICEDDKINFNFFNNVFFIHFIDQDLYFYADFPENYQTFLKEKNQIIFIVEEKNIEYYIYYDKIFK